MSSPTKIANGRSSRDALRPYVTRTRSPEPRESTSTPAARRRAADAAARRLALRRRITSDGADRVSHGVYIRSVARER